MTNANPHSPTTTVRVSDDVLFQDLSGEGVLLNLKTGVYFGLNTVGTRVWHLLEQHTRAAEILEALLREYHVDRERCLTDLLALLDDMREHGLVVLEPTKSSGA